MGEEGVDVITSVFRAVTSACSMSIWGHKQESPQHLLDSSLLHPIEH